MQTTQTHSRSLKKESQITGNDSWNETQYLLHSFTRICRLCPLLADRSLQQTSANVVENGSWNQSMQRMQTSTYFVPNRSYCTIFKRSPRPTGSCMHPTTPAQRKREKGTQNRKQNHRRQFSQYANLPKNAHTPLTILAVVDKLKHLTLSSTIGNETVLSPFPGPSNHPRIPSNPSVSDPNTSIVFPSSGQHNPVALSVPNFVKKNLVASISRIGPLANESQSACTRRSTCSQ